MEQAIANKYAANEEQKEGIIDQHEAQADVEMWRYLFGFAEMALVKCAIELGIADVLHQNGGSMSLNELASSLKCSPTSLYRIMRFLTHRKIFSETQTNQDTLVYTQTPLSRRFLTQGEGAMAQFLLLQASPVMLAPWLAISNCVKEENCAPFDAANGEDLWSFGSNNLAQNKLFNDGMACDARRIVPQIVKGCPNLFDGVSSVVDVGGGDGTNCLVLVEALPWLHCINFDLPHVVSDGVVSERVQHVGGNMFDSVPKADVAYMKWVLHDWGDDECIQILKKCMEAIPKDKGKVIIVETILEEDTDDKFKNAKLHLDMVMLAHTTNGKERTLKEWSYLLNKTGFSHFNVNSIDTVQSVIEAFP